MCKKNLELNNQGLICYKTQPINQPTKQPNNQNIYYFYLFLFLEEDL